MEFAKLIENLPHMEPVIVHGKEGECDLYRVPFTESYPDIIISRAGKACSPEEFSAAFEREDIDRTAQHVHDCFFLVYVHKGSNLEIIEDRKFLVTENDIMFLTPHTAHQNFYTPDSQVVFIHINPESIYRYILPMVSEDILFSSFFSEFLTDQSVKRMLFFPDCMALIRQALVKIVAEYVETPYMHNIMACSLLSAAIIELARIKTRQAMSFKTDAQERVRDILSYITANYRTASLWDTARHFGYHPSYLSSLIRQATGESFRDLILQHKMTQACLFLKERRMSVEQAAYACGYQNVSSFYKAFVRVYRCSPREWVSRHGGTGESPTPGSDPLN